MSPAEDKLASAVAESPETAPPTKPLLCEISWEVCQQVGGIYTVIRSKVPSVVATWGQRYFLLGPYNPQVSPAEFEPTPPTGPFRELLKELHNLGVEAHHGHWLISGRPRVVLMNPRSVFSRLAEIKYLIWEHHHISLPGQDELLDNVLAFGWMVEQCLRALVRTLPASTPLLAHFHEWMGATALPEIRWAGLPVATVFTTHATLLGRYLAMQDPWFYDHVPFVDWVADARRFNIEPQVRLEHAAAHGAHVFTTVSDITAFECEHLLGRKPDALLPNGLNIERFVALHEFQNLHRLYKEQISQFVMAHFFPSYPFDLDRTLYFFTSGRYEYRNKGFDLAIEALARLNWRMKQAGSNRTIVFFIITRQPTRSINAEALRRRAMLQEIRKDCQAVAVPLDPALAISQRFGTLISQKT